MILKNIEKICRAYNPDKGFNYADRQARRMFMVTFAVFGFVMLLAALLDYSLLGATGSVVSLASMAVIGNIDDVSDRDTHGSAISYIVYLVALDQIDRTKPFPQPNAQREVSPIALKPGEIPHYFEAHDIPTLTATTEKGDITTSGENNLVIVMGGARVSLYNFVEEYSGGKFILFFKHIKEKEWYILGELERPIILANTEVKDDKDGRYGTFTFKRNSVDLPLLYTGNPAVVAAGEVAAGATTIAIKANANTYKIANGTSAAAAIANVSGLSKSDKGRYITLVGAGTDKPATIADGSTFVLEDGATWTAKEGASITFRILDTTTLVEVSRTEV
ncbi:hypothetical protein CUC00_08505 [Prevotella intermedia]|uniref:hypothetical protein n=1 Tax=Prevotella intermedia TaxID=28131 RepID=UPI000C1C17B0|nr:hypothetical protein [Prevotella intermedia]ATV32525.1 hypothetical protein CTM44_01430 [Prevotella intermedia]ATV41064.1 hypothetical protein CUC00_08505 [Prevotella intermedia]